MIRTSRTISLLLAALLAAFAGNAIAASGQERQAAVEAWKRGDRAAFHRDVERMAKEGDEWAGLELANNYRFGRGVARDYAKAALWYRKGADRGEPSALARLAHLHLRGWGVARNPEEAYRLMRKAAVYSGSDTPWIWRWLADVYYHGWGTEKSLGASAAWTRKAAHFGDTVAQVRLGLLFKEGMGVVRNVPAALWWLREAKTKGKPNEVLQWWEENPPPMDVPVMAEAVIANIEMAGDPSSGQVDGADDISHPFGIELGAPLPPDFAIDAERSFEEWGNRPALADVFYFEPRHAIAGTVSRPNMTSFTVLTTLISGTAYGVESRGLEFAQRGSCRKTLAAHVRKLVGGRAVRVVRDWPVFLVAVNAPAGFSLDLTPTRWNRWRAFVPDIDSVLNVGGTHPDATAILAECRTEDLSGGPVERGEISVVHLPSLEVRIAEAFEADPFLKETFGQAVAVPANQRPAFMNPFGIPLGEPLALDAVAAKADPVTRGEWVANTQLAVTPPNPFEPFRYYAVSVSPVSKKVLSVGATKLFKAMDAGPHSGRQICWQSMNTTAKTLAATFGAPPPQWNYNDFVGKDWTYTVMDLDPGPAGRSTVSVMFSCDHTTNPRMHDPGFEARYGHPPDDSLWEGSVGFSYAFADQVTELEACALRPLDKECSNDQRREMDIAILRDLGRKGRGR